MRSWAGGLEQGRAAPAAPRPHPNPLPAGEGVRPRAGSPSRGQRAAFFPSTEFCKGLQRGRAGGEGDSRARAPPVSSLSLFQRRPLRNWAGGLEQGRAAPAAPRPHPNPLPAGEGVRPRAGSPSRGQRAAFFPSTEFCKGLQRGRAGGEGDSRARAPPVSSLSLFQRRPLRNWAGGLEQGRAAPASPRPHPNPLPAGEGVRTRAGSPSRGQRAAFFPSTEFCKGLQRGEALGRSGA